MNAKSILLFLTAVLTSLAACTAEDAAKAKLPEATQDTAQSVPAVVTTEVAHLSLSNPSSSEWKDASLLLGLNELGLTGVPGQGLVASDDAGEVPTQVVDFDGDGTPDTLLLLADFEPAQTREFDLVSGLQSNLDVPRRTQAEISIKSGGEWQDSKYVGGRFVNVSELTPPEQYTDHSEYIRYEGPGIESDLVGYRIYQDWRNGFDIFGKRVRTPVLQDIGLDGYDSYHEPAEWGMDVLKVGESLGMGGMGYWDGDKVIRVSETGPRSVRVLDNGPLFSQLGIRYQDWQVAGVTTDLNAQLSMTAGSRLVHTRLQLSEPLGNLVVGIVKHPGTRFIEGDLEISGHAWTYVASWGKQSLNDDHLGMMLLFRKGDRAEQTEDEHNYVSVMKPRNGAVEYYFGAIWEGEPGSTTNETEFVDLLETQASRLSIPLRLQLDTAHTRTFTSGADTALDWSRRLASSEKSRYGDSLAFEGFDEVGARPAAWRYTTGLLSQALDDLSAETGESAYADWARMNMDSYLTDEGAIRTYDADDYNIDKINSGKMLLRLYERHGDEKYLAAAEALRAQLETHPRTSEGAFWHKKIYPGQLWLDGVYMGMPFLAHYAVLTGDDEALEEAVNEFLVTREHLLDPSTGLYYHAWDEMKQQVWADPETGLSPHFWSRGMGWYAMALVDILDFIPEDRADLRQPLIDIINDLATALLEFRASDGAWYQVTNMPEAPGNYLEASGSSMFVYMLAKAVNKGYLPQEYAKTMAAAYADLVRQFILVAADESVSLMNVCAVAGLGFGRDGSFEYYMSEPVVKNAPHGTAPFIMAGIQVSRLLPDN